MTITEAIEHLETKLDFFNEHFDFPCENAEFECPYNLKEILQSLKEQQSQHMYLMADFDNYRKRIVKDLDDIRNRTKEKFVLDMLPIIDDLERLLSQIDSENPSQNEIGFQMTAENLEKMLAANGCKRLDISIGDKFDVNLHEALCTSMVEDESLDDTIAEVFQCGWMLNDKVIRHAKVKVNKIGIL